MSNPMKQIRIKFGGSFQCRLATDTATTRASPRDPSEVEPGRPDAGWTFAYNEPAFDRIIRLSNPVSLRNALIDGFTPTRVTEIEVQFEQLVSIPGVEPPWVPIPVNPLLGVPVSLGPNPMFDTAAGSGPVTQEAILNLQFSIGSDLFKAVPLHTPRLIGPKTLDPAFENPDGTDRRWVLDYLARKPPLVLALGSGAMDTRRFNLLVLPTGRLKTYANFYGYRCPTGSFSLKDVDFQIGQPGILGGILFGWTWSLELSFFRFDGDTLVGQMDGVLSGFHSDFL
jgi:hypothetical protein